MRCTGRQEPMLPLWTVPAPAQGYRVARLCVGDGGQTDAEAHNDDGRGHALGGALAKEHGLRKQHLRAGTCFVWRQCMCPRLLLFSYSVGRLVWAPSKAAAKAGCAGRCQLAARQGAFQLSGGRTSALWDVTKAKPAGGFSCYLSSSTQNFSPQL